MKILFLKYICLPILCLTSGYSYLFLNNKALCLTENLTDQSAAKETRVLIHNPQNNSTKIVIIAPPKQKNNYNKESGSQKNKSILPDVEFLKFIIDKGKEGIPVLKFDGFFAFFS